MFLMMKKHLETLDGKVWGDGKRETVYRRTLQQLIVKADVQKIHLWLCGLILLNRWFQLYTALPTFRLDSVLYYEIKYYAVF